MQIERNPTWRRKILSCLNQECMDNEYDRRQEPRPMYEAGACSDE
jgi:hypothetical protein